MRNQGCVKHLWAASLCLIIFSLFVPEPACTEPWVDVPLVKGAIYDFKTAQISSTNVDRGLIKKLTGGAVKVSLAEKSARAIAKATLKGKATYSARVGTRLRVKRMGGNVMHGKLRVTIYDIAYMGRMATLGASGGHALLRAELYGDQGNIYQQSTILDKTVFIAGTETPQQANISKTFEFWVYYADKDIDVSLFLQLKAGITTVLDVVTGNSEVDFYNSGRGVSYGGVKVEVLEAVPVGSGPGRPK